MNTKEIINKIFVNIFDKQNPYTIKQILDKFAFDIKLPKKVNDQTTNETTYASSINSGKFITLKNQREKDLKDGWMLPKQEIQSLEELLKIWDSVNFTTTERVYDSINVEKSDTIYRCNNIYHSTNCNDAKNLVFCDSCGRSEYLLASQRSFDCNFCMRTDDSVNCSNSYNVICSGKISNCLFIQDSSNLHECIFCSHIANKSFCIANMQFEEEEYYEIKKIIIDWILNS